MRTLLLPVCVLLSLVVGCASGTVATVSPEDGTLYTTLRSASASVLKDGRVAGSGAFIDSRGTFLTAAHVVYDAEHRLELLLPSGQVLPATVLARDYGADIALLQCLIPDGQSPRATPGTWLSLADNPPPAGAQAYVYGAPAMYRDLMLPGRIAADTPRYNHQGANDCYLRSVNLAGPTPPGISGGCWVNTAGEIIGVQCSHIGSDSATTGMAFIAPLDDVRRLIDARADQPAATLGAQVVSLWSQAYGFNKRFPAGSAGVAVHRLIEGGPADRVGLPKDVLITHADGTSTPDVNAFMDVVRAHAPGDTIELTTLAPDTHEPKVFRVELGALDW